MLLIEEFCRNTMKNIWKKQANDKMLGNKLKLMITVLEVNKKNYFLINYNKIQIKNVYKGL